MKCQATFKKHCQFPKCDCDRTTQCGEVALKSCKALSALTGKSSEIKCDCEKIHGVYNCKLNPY